MQQEHTSLPDRPLSDPIDPDEDNKTGDETKGGRDDKREPDQKKS